jgi:hypothetical protein
MLYDGADGVVEDLSGTYGLPSPMNSHSAFPTMAQMMLLEIFLEFTGMPPPMNSHSGFTHE